MKGYRKRKGYKALIIIIITVVVLAAVGGWVYADFNSNNKIKKIDSRPDETIEFDPEEILWKLENGIEVEDWGQLTRACDYVDGRYDCSDFRLQAMMRILYVHSEKVKPEALQRMKDTFLDFKYWMDQPGEDSMCYWSENHQILFAASEYLAGQYYPDEIFTNDGLTGKEHMLMAGERILTWLEQRWLFGFTEWYSSVYYVEDIAPLANLIELAEDDEIVSKATAVMDLLLYDVATQSYQGSFISTSGRAYEWHRKGGEKGNKMKAVIEDIWGFPVNPRDKRGMELCFIYMENYEVPEVIRLIGEDDSTTVIKASNGLDLNELVEKDLIGQEDNQIMMQWAMEGFTNHQVISNTVEYIDGNSMFSNEFLNDIKLVNIGLLKKTDLLPTVSKLLNPAANGKAIQRANTYTYRTSDYMLATAQAYHPGEFSDQQSPWVATISNEVSIFNNHPAKPLSDEGALSGSPGYWVGNGRLPHSVQYENINISIYLIPDKTGFMEDAITDYTHAYFPSLLMDETIIDGRYAFGRIGNSVFSFIGKSNLYYYKDSDDDLIQDGKDNYWIFEISTLEDEGSFLDFMDRIKSNPVDYNDLVLTYQSGEKSLQLEFGSDFFVNGELIDTNHMRHDSPYAVNNREQATMTFEFGGAWLYLDFYNMVRKTD